MQQPNVYTEIGYSTSRIEKVDAADRPLSRSETLVVLLVHRGSISRNYF